MFLNEKQLRKLIREQMLTVLVENEGAPKEEDAAMEKSSLKMKEQKIKGFTGDLGAILKNQKKFYQFINGKALKTAHNNLKTEKLKRLYFNDPIKKIIEKTLNLGLDKNGNKLGHFKGFNDDIFNSKPLFHLYEVLVNFYKQRSNKYGVLCSQDYLVKLRDFSKNIQAQIKKDTEEADKRTKQSMEIMNKNTDATK